MLLQSKLDTLKNTIKYGSAPTQSDLSGALEDMLGLDTKANTVSFPTYKNDFGTKLDTMLGIKPTPTAPTPTVEPTTGRQYGSNLLVNLAKPIVNPQTESAKESIIATAQKTLTQWGYSLQDAFSGLLQSTAEGQVKPSKTGGDFTSLYINAGAPEVKTGNVTIDNRLSQVRQDTQKDAVPFVKTLANIATPETKLGKAIQQWRQRVDTSVTPILQNLTEKQAMDKQSETVQFINQMIESSPYTINSMLSSYGVGFVLNYGMQSQQLIREQTAKAMQDGYMSPEEAQNIMTYASGSALIEAGSEQIFKIGGAGSALDKLVGKIPVKNLISKLLKTGAFLAVQGTQEGIEEVISGIGQGLLARWTVDPSGTQEGDLSGANLAKQFTAGFVMGGIMSAFSYHAYDGFTNSEKVIDELKNVPSEKITVNHINRFKRAFTIDVGNLKNRNDVIKATAKSAIIDGIVLGTDSQVADNDVINQAVSDNEAIGTDVNAEPIASTTSTMPVEARTEPVDAVEPQSNINTSPIEQVATTGSKAVISSESKMQLGSYEVDVERFSTPDGVLEIIKDSPYAPENYHSVYNFLVDENARNKGVGTALITEALKKYGNKLSAQTSSRGSTRLFYKMGFRPRKNLNATLQEALDMFAESESLAMIYNDNTRAKSIIADVQTPSSITTITNYVNNKYDSQTKRDTALKILRQRKEYSFVGEPFVRIKTLYDYAVDMAGDPTNYVEIIETPSRTGTTKKYRIIPHDNVIERVDIPKVVYDVFVDARNNQIPQAQPQSLGATKPTVGGFTIVSDESVANTNINTDTNTITFGKDYLGSTTEKQKQIISHEISHSIVGNLNLTGKDFVATKLFGKQSPVNAEEAVSQMMADLIMNPNFVAEHPNFSDAMKKRYAYVQSLLDKYKGTKSREQVILDDIEKQPLTKLKTIIEQLISERKSLYDSARGDPETIASLDRLISAGQKRLNSNEKSSTEQNGKVTKEDMARTLRSGGDIEAQANEYVASDEGKAELEKYRANPLQLALDIQAKLEEIKTSPVKYYRDKRIFEVEMEIYRIFGDKLKSIPMGKDVNRYVVNAMGALTQEESEEVIKTLEKDFKPSDLFHNVLTDKAARDKADEITNKQNGRFSSSLHPLNWGIDRYVRFNILNQLDGTRMLTKVENTLIGDYLKRLYEQPDGSGKHEADMVIKKVTKTQTQMGQGIQSLYAMYKSIAPEYHANAIEREFTNAVVANTPREKVKSHEDAVEDTGEVIKNVRKKAGHELGETLDDAMQKVRTKRTINVKLSVAELFANRIMASLEAKPESVRAEAEQQILNLYQKYKEVIQYKSKGNTRADAFDLLAEMVVHRDQYKEYWQDARDIIYLNETMNKGEGMNRDNFEETQKYFTEITNPDFVSKFVLRTTVDIISGMNTSVSELARRFFVTGQESISEFTDAIRAKAEASGIVLDEVSYERLERYLVAQFKYLVATKHKEDIKNFAKRTGKYYNRQVTKSEQEQIINDITKATYYDVFADSESEVYKIWAKRLNIPVITDDMKKLIYDSARAINNAKSQSQKDAIYEQMVKQLGDTIPTQFHEKLIAWNRIAMLLKPSYFLRNAIANIVVVPQYHRMDAITNWLMHHTKGIDQDNQIAGDKIQKFNANDVIGKEVIARTSDEDVRRLLSKTSKYSLGTLFGMAKKHFKNKQLQAASDIVTQVASTGKYGKFNVKQLGDLYKYQQWLREAMYNKMIAMGYSDYLTAERKQEIIDTALEYGSTVGTIRTYRNMTMAANLIGALQREALKHGKGGKATYIALKAMQPFVITPAAITSEAYKFSPLALAKALVVDLGYAKWGSKKWDTASAQYKKETFDKLAQATVGTIANFGLGVLLRAAGLLTGDWPEDEDEKAQWIAEGRKPFSIYIPGVGYFSIDWLQPLSTGLMAGAKTFDIMTSANSSTFQKATAWATSNLDVLFNNSLLNNITQTFGSSSYGKETGTDKALNFAQDMFLQGLPGLGANLNRVIDPYTRNVYSGSAMQILGNRILDKIPGGSYLIAPKIDVWGNPVTQVKATGAVGSFERFVANFMTPFNVSPDKMDDITKEVTRVYNESGSTKALPSVIDKKFTRTKKGVSTTYDLTAQEYVDMQVKVGQLSYEGVKKLMASPKYANMTDEKKALALADIYSEAVSKARDDYVKAQNANK